MTYARSWLRFVPTSLLTRARVLSLPKVVAAERQLRHARRTRSLRRGPPDGAAGPVVLRGPLAHGRRPRGRDDPRSHRVPKRRLPRGRRQVAVVPRSAPGGCRRCGRGGGHLRGREGAGRDGAASHRSAAAARDPVRHRAPDRERAHEMPRELAGARVHRRPVHPLPGNGLRAQEQGPRPGRAGCSSVERGTFARPRHGGSDRAVRVVETQ